MEYRREIEKLGVGFGISLNPGETVGMDFEARDVAQIAAMQDLPH